jgi:hypothetical protein
MVTAGPTTWDQAYEISASGISVFVLEPMRVTTLPGRAVIVGPPAMVAVGVAEGAGVPLATGQERGVAAGAVTPGLR